MARRGPPFLRRVRERARGREVIVLFQDEARFGQKGELTRVWARRGSRPVRVRQCRYDYAYLFAAVDPVSGQGTAVLTPGVNAGWMNEHLADVSAFVGDDRHAVLVLDNAGWHHAKRLIWPVNITPLFLPPYSPELNPIERLWGYLKSHYLNNRLYADYEHLLEAGEDAWLKLMGTRDRVRSVCRCPWIMPAN